MSVFRRLDEQSDSDFEDGHSVDGHSDPEVEETKDGGRPDGMGKANSGPRARDWCVTARKLAYPEWIREKVVYFCAQREKGEGGFEHFQCFVQFEHPQRRQTVQFTLGDETAHCEPRKGKPSEARDYCRKTDTAVPGTFFEIGEFRAGKVNHMDDLYAAIKAGASEEELAEKHFSSYARADRVCRKLINLRDRRLAQTRNTFSPPRVIVWIGESGSGKTRRAMDYINRFQKGIHFRKPSGFWFDGYADEECLLLDDFDGDIPITQLLQITDGYNSSLQLPIKGGFILPRFRTILITSNKRPSLWYPDATMEQLQAIERRISARYEYWNGERYVKEEECIEI